MSVVGSYSLDLSDDYAAITPVVVIPPAAVALVVLFIMSFVTVIIWFITVRR